jgi:hypothetical protein
MKVTEMYRLIDEFKNFLKKFKCSSACKQRDKRFTNTTNSWHSFYYSLLKNRSK